jgi:DNA-binding NarL/FixJ family response regulator
MIRVLIADDHAVVRTGVAQVLANADDLQVVGTASGGREAVDMASAHDAQVVLMDLSMPDLDGIEATRAIVERRPDTHVVVLTSFADEERILQALDAGAVGYLLKDAEPTELIAAVRAAARGESPLAPRAATALLRARAQAKPAVQLSDREREVLELLAAGLPNKLIAQRLEISEKTVKAHLTSVFRQIGVDDRTQAALWAQRNLPARS